MLNDKIMNNRNFGIQILRSLLCFWIILNHCLNHNNKELSKILFKYRMHAPCFILIAFYFSNNTIVSRNIIKIKKRFERILIPYFILPILILILNNALYIFTSFGSFGRILNIKDLFYQYLFGRRIIPVFWFQFYLIWSTLFFIIISLLFRKKFSIIIIHIFLISYFLQYSNINFKLFSSFGPDIKYSIGSFVEMLPISATGCFISSLNIFRLINNNIKAIYISIISLYLILFYEAFKFIPTISFSGIVLNVGSVFLFIIFYLFPLNNIKSTILQNILLAVTNYTQGIYSLHLITKVILNPKIKIIENGSFNGCLFLYIFCYMISFLGYKLTKKTKLIYLFI